MSTIEELEIGGLYTAKWIKGTARPADRYIYGPYVYLGYGNDTNNDNFVKFGPLFFDVVKCITFVVQNKIENYVFTKLDETETND